MSMTKEEILKKARDLVTGDRNETHGDAFQNHAEIAEFWNIYLDKKLQPMASITAEDVALMMVLMKISRNTQGKNNKLCSDEQAPQPHPALCSSDLKLFFLP